MNSENANGDRLEQLEIRLTRIERLLTIGFASQIEAVREQAGVGDQVTAAILALSLCWTSSGGLKRAAKERCGQSERTVNRRLTRLVELGALEQRGKTASTEYRSTGLLG
jgi:hypothetical protein